VLAARAFTRSTNNVAHHAQEPSTPTN
jgi:hypothetical protein